MKRGTALLIIIPAAMAVGVVVALLFLASLNDKDDDKAVVPSSVAASSSQYWTGATAGSTPLVPESSPIMQQSIPQPVESVPEPVSSESQSQNIPTPGGFAEAPTVSVSGSTATVTFKTTNSSTVNSILVTSSEAISISRFYDYYNRGQEYEPVVEKKATFKVGPDGVTETYTLPDTSKSYWLLVNTVDNESGEWQPSVTVIPLHSA